MAVAVATVAVATEVAAAGATEEVATRGLVSSPGLQTLKYVKRSFPIAFTCTES